MAGKYDHINFRPPTSVANAAKRGLKMRSKQSKSNQGGTAVGLARANQLAKRETLSPATVKRMKAFFDRHQKNKKVDSGKKAGADKGQQAWLLWGGDAGRGWSAKKVRQMEAADKKKSVKRENNPCGMGKGGLFTKSNWCATGNPNQGKKSKAKTSKPKKQTPALTPKQAKKLKNRVLKIRNNSEVSRARSNQTQAKKRLTETQAELKKSDDKFDAWREKQRKSPLGVLMNNYTFYNLRDFERVREVVKDKAGVFENISDKDQKVFLDEVNKLEQQFHELNTDYEAKRRENGKAMEAYQQEGRKLQYMFESAVQDDMYELGIDRYRDIYEFESDWDEYRILRQARERLGNYGKELNVELGFKTLDEIRAMSDDEAQKYSEHQAIRSAVRTAQQSMRSDIDRRMLQLLSVLDDGRQLRFDFDDAQRGDGFENVMRRMWHEERIEKAEANLTALTQEIGLLELFPDNRSKEQVAQALRLFDQKELIARYRDELRQFEDKTGYTETQYFKPESPKNVSDFYVEFDDEGKSVEQSMEETSEYFKRRGVDVSPEQFAFLGGIGDDATAVVSVAKTYDGERTLVLDIEDGYKADRIVKFDQDGDPYIKNSWFKVRETGRGLGAEIFARQVQAARAAGIKYIKCEAARSGAMNGYITWAKFGYDGPIPERFHESIEMHFGNRITRMRDLMMTAGGKEWWEKNGGSWMAKFDLDPNSYSSKFFEAYLKKKGMYK